MQKIKILLSVLAPALLAACTSDIKYSTGNVGSVGELYVPANNYYVELAGGNDKNVSFSWSPANAADGYSPMYEVVFYKDAAGTQELSRVSAGIGTNVSVPHKTLNKAMNAAGVLPEETGRIWWSVVASRAVTESASVPAPRMLEVKRMKGFKVSPEKLYLVGSATETGADITAARQFSDVGDGEVFEIFTQLKNGEFNACDGLTGESRKFNMDNGMISETNSTPTASSYNGIYRIRVDLSTSSVSVDPVSNVRWVMCIKKNDQRLMNYVGGGVWEGKDFATNFNDGWDDDRYFFRCDVSGVNTKLGGNASDLGSAPANKSAYTWDTYFGVPEGNADWDYSFKVIPFYKGKVGLIVNVTLCLNASAARYYHTIEFPSYE